MIRSKTSFGPCWHRVQETLDLYMNGTEEARQYIHCPASSIRCVGPLTFPCLTLTTKMCHGQICLGVHLTEYIWVKY